MKDDCAPQIIDVPVPGAITNSIGALQIQVHPLRRSRQR